MRNVESLAGWGVLAFLLVILAGVAGWIMNIFAIAGSFTEPLTGLFVLRIVGIFVAPLGAVLGYF